MKVAPTIMKGKYFFGIGMQNSLKSSNSSLKANLKVKIIIKSDHPKLIVPIVKIPA